ncbi:hypothetical protein [Lacinutrix sp. Hel_I_90]|uniref:hypothetical protein n=1 Tax=Lacinutrix sp. Hel_I_90 TaxID=1249999 RepID=UPI0005C88908|nr:hypothetical protein [Lacinutrix sp. Hel_I_90]
MKPIILYGNRASGKTFTTKLLTSTLTEDEFYTVSRNEEDYLTYITMPLLEESRNPRLRLIIISDCGNFTSILRIIKLIQKLNKDIQIVFDSQISSKQVLEMEKKYIANINLFKCNYN